MRRFYIHSSLISGNSIHIVDMDLLHHIKDVLRLKKGDSMIAFDEHKDEYQASICQITPKEIVLEISAKVIKTRLERSALYLAVACALPKKSKFDDIIDGLTQLGVDRIIPLITERVIIKIDDKKAQLKRGRWEKIALQASQQSQRNNLPIIDSPVDFNDLITRSADFDYKLLPTLNAARKTLKEVFPAGAQGRVLICIGPEGDFSEREIKSAQHAHFMPLTLGNLVLRVETAALAAAAIIKSYENS